MQSHRKRPYFSYELQNIGKYTQTLKLNESNHKMMAVGGSFTMFQKQNIK